MPIDFCDNSTLLKFLSAHNNQQNRSTFGHNNYDDDDGGGSGSGAGGDDDGVADDSNAFETVRDLYKIFVPILLCGCLLSLLLNVVLLAVGTIIQMNRSKSNRSRSPIMLLSLNLAATDGLASLLMGIGLFINSYMPVVMSIDLSQCFKLILEIFRLSALIASALHLLALALVHYKGIVDPLHYRHVIFFSHHRTRSIFIMSFICWLIPSMVIGLYFALIPCQGFQHADCRADFILTFRFRMTILVAFFLPLLSMFYLYIKIFTIIKHHQHHRTMNNHFKSGALLKINMYRGCSSIGDDYTTGDGSGGGDGSGRRCGSIGGVVDRSVVALATGGEAEPVTGRGGGPLPRSSSLCSIQEEDVPSKMKRMIRIRRQQQQRHSFSNNNPKTSATCIMVKTIKTINRGDDPNREEEQESDNGDSVGGSSSGCSSSGGGGNHPDDSRNRVANVGLKQQRQQSQQLPPKTMMMIQANNNNNNSGDNNDNDDDNNSPRMPSTTTTRTTTTTTTSTTRITSTAMVKPNNSSGGGGHSKALITTLLILGTYILCWMPAVIFFALTCQDYCYFPIMSINYRKRVVLGFITNGLVIMKAIIDPFIYTYRMKEMKTAINRCFRYICPFGCWEECCPRMATTTKRSMARHSTKTTMVAQNYTTQTDSFNYGSVKKRSNNDTMTNTTATTTTATTTTTTALTNTTTTTALTNTNTKQQPSRSKQSRAFSLVAI